MAVSDFFRRIFVKQSPSQTAIALQRVGQPVSTPRNYEGFSKEAYQKNVIAFRAIAATAQNCAGIPWLLYRKRRGGRPVEITEHPVLDLLERPNPLQSRSEFIERLVAFRQLTGNTYIEAAGPSEEINPNTAPLELWVPRPDRMRIIPGSIGLPAGYIYKVGAKEVRYDVDQIKGRSAILHLKTFNPVDDWYGMSPIEAAILAIDNHNEAGVHNLALLQNRATPSGALVIKVDERNPSGRLTPDQRESLDKKLEEKFSGPSNAGRPIVLEGGMDWREMGLSPQDMQHIEGKNLSSREISLALGMPPVLLGIQGDSTYNNQKEARLAFYEDTVLPIMDHVKTGLNRWLMPYYGDDLYFDYDKDQIDALAPKREAKWTSVKESNFLTINEKREALGYEPISGGDTLFVSSSEIPLDLASSMDDESVDPGSEDLGNPDDETDDGKKKSINFKASENRFFDFVKRFVDRYTGSRVTQIQGTTRKRVVSAIREAHQEHLQEGSNIQELASAIQDRVKGIYSGMSESRARGIARTETTIASNEGSRAAASALGIPNLQKEWISAHDSRTRGSDANDTTNHMKMDGVKVAMDAKFLVPSDDGPDEMDGPGDPSAPVDQIANCRCVQVYDTGDGKSLNLASASAKRRYAIEILRKRQARERAFAVQLKAAFSKEAEIISEAIQGIDDPTLVERVIDVTMRDTRANFEKVFRANVETIMKDFGKDVLKLSV